MKLQDVKFYLLTALSVGAVCLFCLSIWAFFQSFNYAFAGSSSLSHNFGEFEPPSTKNLIVQAMWLRMAGIMLDNACLTVLLPALLAVPIAIAWRKRKSACRVHGSS